MLDRTGDLQPSAATPPRHRTEGRRVHVHSETGRLLSVVIGYPDSWVMADPINKKHQIYHEDHPERPTRERLRPEFDRFRAALETCGVEVIQPEPVEGVPDQLTPRDIGFVIGDTFVVASMSTDCRREEWRGIRAVLDAIPDADLVRAPANVVIEGGDVILDQGMLFVGHGERTTLGGVAFLRERFGDRYEVVPVPLADEDHKDVLHLDCAFVPVGKGHALIYPEDRYEWIEVDDDEQHHLFTNVLSIAPDRVITRDRATRINERLRDIGLDTVEVAFDDTPKCGGSFRCASLPLRREG
ncbi:MAG: dimethylarginine dimethylaminohydrolase family protein [Planctomycetota bacterium]|jgi:N-dimethylarginine dimethylaminohydrolase